MSIAANIEKIYAQIRSAEIQYHREPGSVRLLAVSKGHDALQLKAAQVAGIECFGENYVQEALAKMAAISDPAVEWHFIGRVQSNKAASIAQHFAWVHGIDRLQIAESLSTKRSAHQSPLNVCIQVNITQSTTKNGVNVERLPELAMQLQELKGIRLRGLMAMPDPLEDFAKQLTIYKRVAELQNQLNLTTGLHLDTLSMGMSQDFIAAIAAGSTMVRVGTAIFGAR